jgi:hypothetical protein
MYVPVSKSEWVSVVSVEQGAQEGTGPATGPGHGCKGCGGVWRGVSEISKSQISLTCFSLVTQLPSFVYKTIIYR